MNVSWKKVSAAIFLLGAILSSITAGTASAMNLTVVLPGNQRIEVIAEQKETVGQLKEKIYTLSSLSPLNQLVYKNGKKLQDAKTLSSYGIKDGDSLTVRNGILPAPSRKDHSGTLIVVLGFILIIGSSVYFMMKKPARDDRTG